MLENSISIKHKDAKNYINMDVHELRDLEQGILNYMLLSNNNFIEIQNKLSEDDFTFLIHKVIYRFLVLSNELFLSNSSAEITELNTKIEILAKILHEKENVKITSTLDILSQTPSIYIDSDLATINAYSMEKEVALHSYEALISGTIDTKDGITWFNFINDRLISVGTTNIANLPIELHDNFGDTLDSLSSLDLENGENEANMTFYGDPENPEGIESFYLKKDVTELKWFDNICQWADKYDLDEDTFPRDRFKLQEIFELNLSDKGINELPKEIEKLSNLTILLIDDNNLKNLPKEIYHLKKLRILDIRKNNISYLSEDIINFKELVYFAACYNDIAVLPKNFYTLINLKNICLHGNKLTMISNDICNFRHLKTITISNNDIDKLPSCIVKLKNLESLDIENTNISSIPIDLLKFDKLETLSINDDLLPFIAIHLKLLVNIDTINLVESEYKETSQIVEKLNFNFNQDKWMEKRDQLDNGCLVLSTHKDKENEE